jgi:predicted nucleic acid-binding protein
MGARTPRGARQSPLNAFDTDCLIYAVATDNALGQRVVALVDSGESAVGSVMLLPELLIKPVRNDQLGERERLSELLARLHLIDVDTRIAQASVLLGAKYGLRSIDSVHLATAVVAGADRFITNNRRDFTAAITEIDVVYPGDL